MWPALSAHLSQYFNSLHGMWALTYVSGTAAPAPSWVCSNDCTPGASTSLSMPHVSSSSASWSLHPKHMMLAALLMALMVAFAMVAHSTASSRVHSSLHISSLRPPPHSAVHSPTHMLSSGTPTRSDRFRRSATWVRQSTVFRSPFEGWPPHSATSGAFILIVKAIGRRLKGGGGGCSLWHEVRGFCVQWLKLRSACPLPPIAVPAPPSEPILQ